MMSNQRLGFLGIILEDRKATAKQVNQILSEFGDNIIARVGIPYKNKNCSIITLTLDITTDQLGTLSGRLGAIQGITVKSALSKLR